MEVLLFNKGRSISSALRESEPMKGFEAVLFPPSPSSFELDCAGACDPNLASRLLRIYIQSALCFATWSSGLSLYPHPKVNQTSRENYRRTFDRPFKCRNELAREGNDGEFKLHRSMRKYGPLKFTHARSLTGVKIGQRQLLVGSRCVAGSGLSGGLFPGTKDPRSFLT